MELEARTSHILVEFRAPRPRRRFSYTPTAIYSYCDDNDCCRYRCRYCYRYRYRCRFRCRYRYCCDYPYHYCYHHP